ncbi:MAG: hypothetical protein ACE5GT_13330, partial [Rhodospirillales bacterium]
PFAPASVSETVSQLGRGGRQGGHGGHGGHGGNGHHRPEKRTPADFHWRLDPRKPLDPARRTVAGACIESKLTHICRPGLDLDQESAGGPGIG